MWQTKYAAAIPKNLGLGLNFRPCSEGFFLSGCPQSVTDPNQGDPIFLLPSFSKAHVNYIPLPCDL